MDNARLGRTIRALRIRRGWRQADLAAAARVSRSLISLIELGHVDRVTVRAVGLVAGALGATVDLGLRWHGGDLDRLVNARHSAVNETVAAMFQAMPGWIYAPEVSFSIYGERGVIDGLAWQAKRAALLVVELKTELVDVNELLGTLDRKRRLARQIARDRGWLPASVSIWLAIAESRTNRRHVTAHRALLGSVLVTGPAALRAYLSDPIRPVSVLTFVSDANQQGSRHGYAPRKRVRIAPTDAPGRSASSPEAPREPCERAEARGGAPRRA